MKFKAIVEYEYPIEHKPPVKAEIVLHGDRVITDNIKWVEQEPKMGHWIENAPEYQNIDPPYICSECGNMHLRKTNYCDQCGCRMFEPQESEEISDTNLKMWEGIFKAESEDKE